jgi:hypothetical protein
MFATPSPRGGAIDSSSDSQEFASGRSRLATNRLGQRMAMIPDILEEHLEVLSFLWMKRNQSLRSMAWLPRDMETLDERMESHVKAIIVGGAAVIPFLEEGLAEDDPSDVFAATYVLLRIDTESAAERVIAALQGAEEAALEGICAAICLGPVARLERALEDTLANGAVPIAAAAARALASHGRLDADKSRLAEFLSADDPAVRRIAWHIVALLGQ